MFLCQIISLNHAIKFANETNNLTSVSNGINQQAKIDLRSKNSYNQSNSSNTNITSKVIRYPPKVIKILHNSTDIGTNSSKIINSRRNLNSKRQLEKHFYNITLPPTNSTTKLTNENRTSDDLHVSDSRNAPKISRFDEDTEEEQQQSQMPDEDDSVDGASSNLNEQKVVRELTKILSRGMSGATDQVKLDTLEQWKRRQRERKVVKDSRAKLFEDLLTAAINTHPENVKKYKKRKKLSTNTDKDENNKSPSLLSTYPNIDPELSSDAETVIQHLQGLASVIDGKTPTFSPAAKFETGDSLSGGSDESSSGDNYSSSPDNYGNDNESSSEEKGGTKTKIASSSNDRPIVKQFKQIKNKISQRRKQLDQIKKIFNVDLSLNKDGSLQGKTSSSSSKKNKGSTLSELNEAGDYPDQDEGSSSTKVKKKSSSLSSKKEKEKDKVQDLMSYLKENPEILASVMDELNANTEYTPKSIGEGETLFQSSDDSNQLNYPSMSRKLYSSARLPDIENINLDKAGAYRRSIGSSDLSMNNYDFNNSLRGHKVRNLVDNFQNNDQILNTHSNNAYVPLLPKQLSGEALLLESLRERQLMNLARLEKVLAERYQSSNRSQVYSSSDRLSRTSNFSPRSQLLPPSPQTLPIDNRQEDIDQQRFAPVGGKNVNNIFQNQRQYSNNLNISRPFNTGHSDEEVLHHYMVMNPPSHPNNGPDLADDNVIRQNQLISKPRTIQPQQLLQMQQKQPQPLQQQSQLNRFRDWRDVSHSEASSSQRSDKTNSPNNITRFPFDPTTSGSVAPVDTHDPPSVHSNGYQLTSFLRQSSTNDAKIDTNSGTYSTARNYADTVVTKPGPQIITNSFQNNYHNSKQPMRPTNSLFETRSSIIRSKAKPQPQNTNVNVEADLDDVGNSKTSPLQEETILSSNDDGIPAERTRRTTNSMNGPSNYFSAYKRAEPLVDSNQDKSNHQETSIEKDKQQELENDSTESDNGDAGAMWAR